MVQATPAPLHLLRPLRTECRIRAFYSEGTPSPTLNYCFPFEGSCFLTLDFTAKETGDLTAYRLRVGQQSVVEKSDLYFFQGQVSSSTSLAASIPRHGKSKIMPDGSWQFG